MDLSEYISVEERCRALCNDVEGLKQRVKNIMEDISATERQRDLEISSISLNKKEYVQKRIQEETYSKTNNLRIQRAEIETQLALLKSQPYTIDKEKLKQPYAQDIALYQNVILGTKQDRQENKLLFDIIKQNNDESFSQYGINSIRKELTNYQTGSIRKEMFTAYSQIDAVLSQGIFRIAALFRFLKGWERLAFLCFYYFVVTFAMIVCMPVLIVWYTKLSIDFIKADLMFREEQIDAIHNVTLYSKIAEDLRRRIKELVNAQATKEMSARVEDKATQIKSKTQQLKALNLEISKLEAKINGDMTAYSQTNNYEKEQESLIRGRHEEHLDILAEKLDSAKKLLDELSAEQEVLIEKRNLGKATLEQMYFMLDKCGQSKILPKKFLLGFNEYVPVTMDMNNYCINLLCNQGSDKLNVDFVIMCLAQILCTVNPSCVKISVVDINHGTTNFGIFNNIPEVVTVIKTQEELNSKLDELFELKATRDRDIMKKADDITAYNTLMIENYGLTLPYEILIVAHHVDSLIGSHIFKQLQSAGNLGIVTISMWDMNIVRFNPRYSKEYYSRLIPYLTDMDNIMYYGGDGGLSCAPQEYLTEKITNLKMGVRSLK